MQSHIFQRTEIFDFIIYTFRYEGGKIELEKAQESAFQLNCLINMIPVEIYGIKYWD